jgi:hypothetical protein
MSTTNEKISPEDLQRKLQSFQDGIQGKVEDKKSTLMTVSGVALVVLLVVVFLVGKRAGKKKSTLVEIRRL